MNKPFNRYALIHHLVALAAEAWEIKTGEIFGRRRTRVVSDARQAVCLVATRLLNRTTIEVGKALGRDHSTISVATRDAAGRLLRNKEFARRYETFCALVEGIRPVAPIIDSLDIHEPTETAALSRLVALQRREPRVFQMLLEIARLNGDWMAGADILLAQAKEHRAVTTHSEATPA